jgi:hypothetical protein
LPFPLDDAAAKSFARELAVRLGNRDELRFEESADELVYEIETWWPTERTRYLSVEVAPQIRLRLSTTRSADSTAFRYCEISPDGEAALEELLDRRASVEPVFHPSLAERFPVGPVERRWSWLDEYPLHQGESQLFQSGPIACTPQGGKRLVVGPVFPSGKALHLQRNGRGGAPSIVELHRALFAQDANPVEYRGPRECFLALSIDPQIHVYRTATHWLRFARQDPGINGVFCVYAIQSRDFSLLAIYEIWGRSMVIHPGGDNEQNFFAFVSDPEIHSRLHELLGRDRWRL